MRIILFKVCSYIAEENRFGYRSWNELPSSILLAASYLERQGIKVDLFNEDMYTADVFDGYDVAIEWISIADGLYEGLDYLRLAKSKGCKSVLVLFDDWEGMQKQILQDYDFIDFGIRGWDVEETIRRLINSFHGQADYGKIEGLVYRSDNAVVDNGRALYFRNSLEHLGSSRQLIQLLDPKLYDNISIRVSSGCPFPCTFCHIGSRPARFRNYSDVVDELEGIGNGRHVKLLAGDILINPEWVESFCNQIIARRIPISWETDIRLSSVKDDSILQLMKRAGCSELTVGVESFHPGIMKAIKKGYDTASIIPLFEKITRQGIRPSFSMLIGHPLDSDETLGTTFKMLNSIPIGVKTLNAQYLRPLPGTQIEKEALQLGLLKAPLPYSEFVRSRNKPNLPTQFLGINELEIWQNRLTAEVTRINSINMSSPINLSPSKARGLLGSVKDYLRTLMKNESKQNANICLPSEPTFSPEDILSISPHSTLLYEYLIGYLLDHDYKFITLAQIDSVDPGNNKYVILRHDIDYNPEKTELLVSIERKHGVYSEIYLITDKSYYDIKQYDSYFKDLNAEGFLIGLHTLAPSRNDFIAELRKEVSYFNTILDIIPSYFTIHGVSPHPEYWAEKRHEFITCINKIKSNMGIKDSHSFHNEIVWIEDTGVGGEFCYIRNKWIRPDSLNAQILGVLTHQLHWQPPCVPWPVNSDEIKEDAKLVDFIRSAKNGLAKSLKTPAK